MSTWCKGSKSRDRKATVGRSNHLWEGESIFPSAFLFFLDRSSCKVDERLSIHRLIFQIPLTSAAPELSARRVAGAASSSSCTTAQEFVQSLLPVTQDGALSFHSTPSPQNSLTPARGSSPSFSFCPLGTFQRFLSPRPARPAALSPDSHHLQPPPLLTQTVLAPSRRVRPLTILTSYWAAPLPVRTNRNDQRRARDLARAHWRPSEELLVAFLHARNRDAL